MTARISAADLDAAIIGYLPSLDKAQKEAVLNFLKAFTPVPDAGDHWDDPAFVAEMDRRYEDYKNNPERMKTLDEVMEGIDEMLQANRQKKGA